ncbi:DsbA family protein [Rhodanobacter lindaniclasticus]
MYGKADARFTIVEYADLECPFCQSHVPMLRRWIDANPEVNLQWHHLPLSMHEPAATRQARLAECAGETGGHAAFWNAIGWIYQHTSATAKAFPTICNFPGPRPRCVPAWIAPVQKASSRSKPPKLHNRVLRRRQRCA